MPYKRFPRTADTFLVIPFLKKRTFSTATEDFGQNAPERIAEVRPDRRVRSRRPWQRSCDCASQFAL